MTIDDQLFAGQTAVITGGARGLGLAMAEALAHHGADVALLDQLDTVMTTAAQLAGDSGRRVIGANVDVTSPESLHAAFDTVQERLGVAQILVCSAGISLGLPTLETTPEQWRHVIDVNLTGVLLTAQEFAHRVVAADKTATIVNISSMSAFIVNIPQTQTAYNVSKAGVAMLTRSLAVEWSPLGIRVNAIAPGYFVSDMTRDFVAANPEMAQEWMAMIPQGRMGNPEELGELVVYLASDRSRYVVGQNILIDGGYTIV